MQGLRAYKSECRHFRLEGIFIFTAAMSQVISNHLAVISLHLFNTVVDKKIDHGKQNNTSFSYS